MEPPTIGIEVGEKCHGGDGVLKSLGVLEIFVPDLLDGVLDKFYEGALGGFKESVVHKEDVVCSLNAGMDV